MIVFGAGIARAATVADVERCDSPRLYVRRGGVSEFCASRRFWELLAGGPVVVWFEDRVEAAALLEAYADARRRRLH